MYGVMIVDDEPLMRQGLRLLVDWAALRCEIVAEAENGDDAWELLERLSPDILICDIKMPGMDGLSLGQRLRGRPVKLIYLTAYPEFSYVQTAVRLSAVDYVLKSNYLERIPQAIQLATAQLEREREETEAISRLKQRLNSRESEGRERLVREWISAQDAPLPGQAAEMKEAGLWDKPFHMLAVKSRDAGKPRDERARRALREMLLCALQPDACVTVTMENGVAAVLAVHDGPRGLAEIKRGIVSFQQAVQNSLGEEPFIGVSAAGEQAREMARGYRQAYQAMEQSVFWERRGACCYEETPPSPSGALKERMEQLLMAVGNHSAGSLSDAFEEILQAGRRENAPVEQMKTLAVNLCSLFLHRRGAGTEQLSAYGRMLRAKNGRELQKELAACLGRRGDGAARFSQLVEAALAVIRQSYGQPLNVNQIAGRLHVNSGYLGNLFRKETGESMTDALLHCRMERALILLANPDLKIFEIAEAVGFSDAAYFTNVFTRHMGMSPRAYRATIH